MADMPMPEGAPPQAPDDGASDSPNQPQTASLPIDFCPGMTPKEGDVLKVKVVAVDADNGSMDVVYIPGGMPKPGIKSAAAQFDGGEGY